jgi:gamma-glutamylcyclotransferase (GGCT)/AIG2-like uncharacterized protein YtfP
MSTPGPERVPSKVKVDKTSGQGKPPAGGAKPKPGAAKSTGAAKSGAARPGAAKPGAAKPGAKGGGKGRKPVTPVKVSGSTNWGPIAIGGVVGVVVLAILGYAVFSVVRGSRSWEDKAADIKGIVNYRAQKNAALDSRNHKDGTLTYLTSPPVGGDHNPLWQNCMGDVYDQAIANEHAVHSLEHGAVWVTYKPGIPQDQIDDLKKKVQGKDYMLMSPYPGLDHNISLQVWGYQLKVDDATDPRIDEFIKDLRLNASMETGAACSSGNTTTGPVTAAATGQPGATQPSAGS